MVMIQSSGRKKTSRDFQDRGWLVEGIVLFSRSAPRFQTSPSALLKKEVAVSKGEIEKCTSATHSSGNYRKESTGLSRFFRIDMPILLIMENLDDLFSSALSALICGQ